MKRLILNFVFFFVPVVCQADYLLFCTMQGCGPCELNKPILHKLIQQGVDIRIVHREERRDVFNWFHVTRTPTFIRIDKWPHEVSRVEGFQDAQQVKSLLQEKSLVK